MSAQDMRGSRRWSIGVLPAAVVLAGVAPQLVLAADDVAAAAPTGGTFLQRAALLVPELSEELPFWTDGLGMKVLQSSAGKAVLGYGPEGQGSASGGHFAIELFEDADESIKPPVGWQRMEVVLPYTTNRVLNVEEAGGKLLPRWFGTANFVEVTSPSGYVVRIVFEKPEAVVPYPLKALVTCTTDMAASKAYFKDTVGMVEDGGMFSGLPFVGGGRAELRFRGDAKTGPGQPMLVLEKTPDTVKPPSPGGKGLWSLEAVQEGEEALLLEDAASFAQMAVLDGESFRASLPVAAPPPPPAPTKKKKKPAAPPAEEEAPPAPPPRKKAPKRAAPVAEEEEEAPAPPPKRAPAPKKAPAPKPAPQRAAPAPAAEEYAAEEEEAAPAPVPKPTPAARPKAPAPKAPPQKAAPKKAAPPPPAAPAGEEYEDEEE